MTEEVATGWVKPVAKPIRESLQASIADLHAELAQGDFYKPDRAICAGLELDLMTVSAPLRTTGGVQ